MHKLSRIVDERKGAILPLVAFLLPVMIIFLGFSIDLAFMQRARIELRSATDAAARAAAIELSKSGDLDQARTAAKTMASLNQVAGKPLVIADSDVEFGRSERDASGAWGFVTDATPMNSVRITGDRSGASVDGAVNLYFNSFYGGPDYEPSFTAVSSFLNVDVCLVLDRSGSMEGQKLTDLQTAVAGFFTELELTSSLEKVALASYSDASAVDQGLTTDYAVIKNDVNNFLADGYTAIGLALYSGMSAITGANASSAATPVVVLMTDGLHNRGVEPSVPALEAEAQGIIVHTITFGADADLVRMHNIANQTGGRHYHADTGAELASVFRQIARTLPVQLTQ